MHLFAAVRRMAAGRVILRLKLFERACPSCNHVRHMGRGYESCKLWKLHGQAICASFFCLKMGTPRWCLQVSVRDHIAASLSTSAFKWAITPRDTRGIFLAEAAKAKLSEVLFKQ